MREDQAPPPHGAESPKAGDDATPLPPGAGMGTLGFTLIGGAVAAAVGLLVAIPLVRRAKQKPASAPKPKPTPQARRPRRKRTDA